MWRTLAKVCAWFYVRGVRAKTNRNKRRVEINAILSKAWSEDTLKGYGNRELFTIELSQWLWERNDSVQIDELVDYIHDEHVYLIRKRRDGGATPERRKRT